MPDDADRADPAERRPRTAGAAGPGGPTSASAAEYPGTAEDLCALEHRNPYELLAATILSAQCTDERVNMVTPHLFARYPTPEDLAGGGARSTSRRSSARPASTTTSARASSAWPPRVVERFGGEVPEPRWRTSSPSPGVGRKTANVLRSVAMDLPGLPVDTHVGRLSRRLDLTQETDPVKAELALNPMVPAKERGDVQPPPHPARPGRLRRPQAPLRRLRAGRLLPERLQGVSGQGSRISSGAPAVVAHGVDQHLARPHHRAGPHDAAAEPPATSAPAPTTLSPPLAARLAAR